MIAAAGSDRRMERLHFSADDLRRQVKIIHPAKQMRIRDRGMAGNSLIEEFKVELKDFSTSKGTVHFPNNKPLPTALVKNLVKARVRQSDAKKRG